MTQYIQCPKCKQFTIEVIGDEELTCDYCENDEGVEE